MNIHIQTLQELARTIGSSMEPCDTHEGNRDRAAVDAIRFAIERLTLQKKIQKDLCRHIADMEDRLKDLLLEVGRIDHNEEAQRLLPDGLWNAYRKACDIIDHDPANQVRWERLSNQERIAAHQCDQCAQLEDLLADIKPDAGGTLVERVEALLELAQLDKRQERVDAAYGIVLSAMSEHLRESMSATGSKTKQKKKS